MEEAFALERQQQFEQATDLYEQILQRDPLSERAYDRLMIIFRKQKAYKKENEIIKQAIGAYEHDRKEDIQAWAKSHKGIAAKSKALAKSLGLLNKSGLPAYEKAQVVRWRKRLEVVKKKLSKG